MITGELIPATSEDTSIPARNETVNAKYGKASSHKKPARTIQRAPAECGSMVFWNVPANCAPLESDVFFNTISMEAMLEELDNRRNIVFTMISIKLRHLSGLRNSLISGRILIDLRRGTVSEENEELIQELASLSPRSVSWSNLVDYAHLHSYHKVAHRLKGSRHFGYSMKLDHHHLRSLFCGLFAHQGRTSHPPATYDGVAIAVETSPDTDRAVLRQSHESGRTSSGGTIS